MGKSGLAFHVHHDTLVEYCYDYDERVKFIKEGKPEGEKELRLRLFQLIPEDRLPQEGLEAYDKAREARNKAGEAYNKAREACNKAWEAYNKAREAYNKAREAYDTVNKQALEQIHNELCTNCPWDGKSIFN